ncbi:MAG: FAD-linked oxidase C-terminal domain-containing protein [Methylocella sp.]
MNKIVEVHAADLDVVVQAGATRKQLNEYLRDMGLFFPVDPGAEASIGGMAATRASGTNSVRYGTMRDNVLSMQVVLPDGRIICTSSRARKSSAGYDLTRVFVGSEGTLGVITEITLRVYGIPEVIASAVCAFPTLGDAVSAAIMTMLAGVPIARIELGDELCIEAFNKYSKLDHKVAPTLFLEFHGAPRGVDEQAEMVKKFALERGGTNFKWSASPEERANLWQARHDGLHAVMALRPGCKAWPTEVCVPISQLSAGILETKADIDATRLLAPIAGHVGDGNFHVVFILDPNNAAELAEAEKLNKRIIARALRMDGACTGEHGVGYGKMPYLEEEHGEALDVMKLVKHALDPQNIMNPGKVVNV